MAIFRRIQKIKMRRIILLGLMGLMVVSAGAQNKATVVYHSQRFTGTVNNRQITIKLRKDGLLVGTNLIFNTPVVMQPSAGVATTNLYAGGYLLQVDQVPTQFPFDVPDSTNTYELSDLINRNLYVLTSGSNIVVAASGNATAVTNGAVITVGVTNTPTFSGAYFQSGSGQVALVGPFTGPGQAGVSWYMTNSGSGNALSDAMDLTINGLALNQGKFAGNGGSLSNLHLDIGVRSGNTWLADSNIDLGTIISNAAAGDTITVKRGTYTVSNGILIPIGVTVRAEGLPLIKSFVDGTSGSSCFNMSDNTILDGFEITNCIADTKFQVCVGTHDNVAARNATNWVVKNCFFHGDSDCVVIKTDSARTIGGAFYDCIGLSKWDCFLLFANNGSANISCVFWNCAGIIYTESVKTPGMSGYTHAIGADGSGKVNLEIHGGYFASTNNSRGFALAYINDTGPIKTLAYGATFIGTNAVYISDCPSGSAGWRARLFGCNLVGPVFDASGALGPLDGPADIQVISGGMDSFNFRRTLVNANGAAAGSTIMGDGITSAGADTVSALAPTSSEGVMRRQTSDTTSGGDTGASGNLNYRTGRFNYFKAAIKQDVIITKRFFYGLSDQTLTTMGGSDDPSGNYAGFLLTTNTSFVWTVTKDNSTQTSTITAQPQDTATTHIYEVICDDDYPRVIFKIDGYVVAIHTTHLPSASTNLRYVIGGKKYDGTIRNTDIEYIDIRSNR
jgi:hypothetical protein